MIRLLPVLGLLMVPTLGFAAEGEVKAADDYSSCLPPSPYFPFTIGPKGNFQITDQKNPNIKIIKQDETTEVLQSDFVAGEFMFSSRYTAKKKDGRILGMEISSSQLDKNGKKKKVSPYFDEVKSVSTFSFDGKKCQVEQNGMKYSSAPKEKLKVLYDRKLCQEIRPLMDKIGGEKLQECLGVMTQIEGAINSAEKRISADGSAELGFQAPGTTKGPMGTNANNNIWVITGQCAMAQGDSSYYGKVFGIGIGMAPYGSSGAGFGGQGSAAPAQ